MDADKIVSLDRQKNVSLEHYMIFRWYLTLDILWVNLPCRWYYLKDVLHWIQVEFDSPKELLKIKDGKLRALVEESSDREDLYAMAGVAWVLLLSILFESSTRFLILVEKPDRPLPMRYIRRPTEAECSNSTGSVFFGNPRNHVSPELPHLSITSPSNTPVTWESLG
jgi:hypothetical protein